MDALAKKDLFRYLLDNSYLFGSNAPYIEELYSRFLQDPQSVGEDWRRYFENLQVALASQAGRDVDHQQVQQSFRKISLSSTGAETAPTNGEKRNRERLQVSVLQLINAYRYRGHQHANIDPINLRSPEQVPDLNPEFHGLGEEYLDRVFNTGSFGGTKTATLRQILVLLKETYCGHLGVEYMHITSTMEKRWIQNQLEVGGTEVSLSPAKKRQILERVIAAEGLEQYLHVKYVGQKRFSLEGSEALVPLLDEMIQRAGANGAKEVVLGMAHRGRLNVLVNIVGKSPRNLFREFEGHFDTQTNQGSGDVKYHQGFSSDVSTEGGAVHLTLAFNPSHLEIVNPVVEGSVRARQHRRGDHVGRQVLPVLIHGDSAFAGQGVVMETLQMSQARGYTTGGTVHIIINNQIGFTTSHPMDMRSSSYCTEVAKMVQAPILHVNGDYPEAVIKATQIALDYRMQFKKDVVVDVVCYRRHGHNEADEPVATQPMMYRKIKHHPTLVQLYTEYLIKENTITAEEVARIKDEYRQALDEGRTVARGILTGVENDLAIDWTPFKDVSWTHSVVTSIPVTMIQRLVDRLLDVPEGFALHSSVQKIMDNRRRMAQGELPVDWGFAETLAYAALLCDGYPIRISGQDSGRGTFFHRHAVLHHQETGDIHVPLQHIGEAQPSFVVIDSLLSEEAILGFEYGYASSNPNSLVIWEAQFGDFANGAQVVIDQFISSGEEKWARLCGLVMFLPHGYDGQGPEHSSARLERYLQLCAEENMQVCVPSVPAQMFHLIRRQMLRPLRKPLIVMTPKSLLRHKISTSTVHDLAEGTFQNVIGELDALDPKNITDVVVCSGKIYFELLQERRELNIEHIALVRLEQLYPFPKQEFAAELARYPKVTTVRWCQEEPRNQGAWRYVMKRLRDCMTPKQRLTYSTRPPSASPAVGYIQRHLEQQRAVVEKALGIKKKSEQ